jgi:hypothetical protein
MQANIYPLPLDKFIGNCYNRIDCLFSEGKRDIFLSYSYKEKIMASSAITLEQLTQSVHAMAQVRDRMAEENEKMYQEVWATLREVSEKQKETSAQIEKMKEGMDRTYTEVGAIGNKLGVLMEAMFSGGALKKFQDLGFEFTQCSRRVEFSYKKRGIRGEIDILLEGEEKVMLVEVKTTLEISDITDHIKRMEDYKLCTDARGDKRRFMAAVAGGVITEKAEEFALAQGIYIIRQSGGSKEILAPEEKREW